MHGSTTSRSAWTQRTVRSLDRLLTPTRLRIYPVALLGGFLFVWGYTLLAGRAELLPDFQARWTAGRLLLDGQREQLYDPGLQSALQVQALGSKTLSWFVSPPFVAAIFVPFAALPYPLAAAAWTLLSLLLYFASLRMLRSLLAPAQPLWTRFVLIVTASHPVLELFASGQDTALVLFSTVLTLRLLETRRDLLAGLAGGLCFAKPQLAFLLPFFFLLRRRWLALAGISVTGFVAGAISLGLVGWQGVRLWLAVPTSPLYAIEVQQGQAWKGASLPAFLTSLAPSSVTAAAHGVAIFIGLGFAAWGLWRIRARTLDGAAAFVLALLTTVVASPHAMVYDLVIVAPTVAVIVQRGSAAGPRVLLAGCFVLLWLGPALHALARSVPWPLSVVGAPWAAALLVVLWIRALRGASRPDAAAA